MALPDQFLQASSLTTLSGAAILVWLISGGLRYFTGFFRKWVPLVVSAIVIAIIQGVSSIPLTGIQFLLLVGNTFLLAFTSIGLNETLARGAEKPQAKEFAKAKVPFNFSWFG